MIALKWRAVAGKGLPLTGFTTRNYSPELTDRQRQMMAKSLPKKKTLDGVKNVILVASGKGGVGKSTTAVNLAMALSTQGGGGRRVGILDADIYGPSIPLMMNLTDQEPPLVTQEQKMVPLQNYGVKCMSMGFLLKKAEDAVVWRGPMVMGAIQKLAFGTAWGALDILIVDMPPGTGDIHLSVAQTIDVKGAVVVSTPQSVALIDAKKAVSMFKTVGIPVVGLVENMSRFVCGHCGHETKIFGGDGSDSSSKSESLAKTLGVPYLGDVPIEPKIMQTSDEGTPIVIKYPESESTNSYIDLSNHLIRVLAE